jgi:hypothetical protein
MPHLRSVLAVSACLLSALTFPASLRAAGEDPVFPEFQDTFLNFRNGLHYRGTNDYYIRLVPGFELLLAGDDDGESKTLLISVLDDTRVVAGVRCAIVREMEWTDGDLVEISWNYFAISRKHAGIFYFGEQVDIYEDGEVVSHAGAWLAGQHGNKAGLIMPGQPLVGSRYYQEIAPGVAEDRAEHLSVTELLDTPGGTFANCLFVEESTPVEPGHFSYKYYAPGIGLVKDGPVELVDHGFDVELPDGLEGAPDDDDDGDDD